MVFDRGRGILGELAHPGQHRPDGARDHRVRVCEPCDDDDMPGEVATLVCSRVAQDQAWNPSDATNVKFGDLLSSLVTTKSS